MDFIEGYNVEFGKFEKSRMGEVRKPETKLKCGSRRLIITPQLGYDGLWKVVCGN